MIFSLPYKELPDYLLPTQRLLNPSSFSLRRVVQPIKGMMPKHRFPVSITPSQSTHAQICNLTKEFLFFLSSTSLLLDTSSLLYTP